MKQWAIPATLIALLFFTSCSNPVLAYQQTTIKAGDYANPLKFFTNESGSVGGFWPGILADIFQPLANGYLNTALTNNHFPYKQEVLHDISTNAIVLQPAQLRTLFTRASALAPYLTERADYYIRARKRAGNLACYRSLVTWLEAILAIQTSFDRHTRVI